MARAKGFRSNQNYILICTDGIKYHGFTRGYLLIQAFSTLVFVSYIQPFVDGNKRTARILSNAILLANSYYPLSYRSVDEIEYKKALIIFYEQFNIYYFKKIFLEQYQFSVDNYFK